MDIRYEGPSAKEYIDLRIKTNMGEKKLLNTEIDLANSIFIVSIWEDDKLIGFGRIVGDKGISYVISDIMVDPDYQGKGIGKTIMKEIDDYLEVNTDEDAYIILLAKKPADKLYSKFNFIYAEPESCGMRRKQTKK